MEEPNANPRGGGIPWWLVLLSFLGIAAVLLWEEHEAHFLGALPYIFLLACPLMHVFMHRGHGHENRDEEHSHHSHGPHSSEGGSR